MYVDVYRDIYKPIPIGINTVTTIKANSGGITNSPNGKMIRHRLKKLKNTVLNTTNGYEL